MVGNAVSNALDVGWTANTDTRDGFKVYRSTDGVQFDLVQTVTDPAARTWRDSGTPDDPLVVGRKYWYRVRAYTDANGVSASVTKASGIPTQPTPIATGIAAAGIGPGRISVIWKAPADTSVAGYRIYRSTTPDFLPSDATFVTAVDGTKHRIIDSGLSRGHTYYYLVVAVGVGNSVSMPSATTAALAQNEGPGLSNGGTPFDPATHDSDGDGIPDAQDFDNDNDGITDEQDPDDNNDGINDNADGDDRDTDGDGIADNSDNDDDNDGLPDNQDGDQDGDGVLNGDDPSSGDIDVVPSGAGKWNIYNNGSMPQWVNFSYDKPNPVDSNGQGDGDDPVDPGPQMFFSGDDVNGNQTLTFRNLPKHAVVEMNMNVEGSGFGYAASNYGDPGEVAVTLGSKNIAPDVIGRTFFRRAHPVQHEY